MEEAREKELKVIYIKCRGSFLFYVRYMFRELYGSKYIIGEHHIKIAETLERVVRGEIIKLIINIAPRYGKTELVVKMFISWVFAFNPAAKFLHLSYSDTLALDNSGEIKDIIQSDTFRELFGEVEIRKDKNSVKKWYTTDRGGVYATSTGGQVTGFGAGKMDEGPTPAVTVEGLLESEALDEFAAIPNATSAAQWVEDFNGATIIDDPNKPEDAGSSLALEKVNTRFESTIRHRVNSRRTPIIVVGQRIDPDDLCGHLTKIERDDWHVLSLPCIKSDGSALWPHKHSVEELHDINAADALVYQNQYLQNPRPREGLMYGEFGTYTKLPPLKMVKAYVDTADEGKDFLCSIVYGEPEDTEDRRLYLLHALYTQEGMEATEPLTADQLEEHGVRRADVESNSGGRSFARKINELTSSDVFVSWFHQSKNKASRIYLNSGSVNSTFLMPEGWDIAFPKFYDALTSYKKNGAHKSNAHDDAPDALTGCYEKTKTKRKLF